MGKQEHYEVAVIGAGSMGMAAGSFLARQGKKTLMIDAFDPPHMYGSHHGETRIIRHAYAEGKQYVPLVLRAQQLWNELESETGSRLFYPTGVLSVGQRGAPFIGKIVKSAEQYRLPLEMLEAEEICRRWPGIHLSGEYLGCLEKKSGVLMSEECIRALKQAALANGAQLLCGQKVKSVDITQRGAIVKTDATVIYADAVVICAGAWARQLLDSIGVRLRLQPIRKTVAWFEADAKLYDWRRFPAFDFVLPHGLYYGFPSFDGNGIKVGRHDGGQPSEPDQVNREFGAWKEDEQDLRTFLQDFMPNAAGVLRQGKVCLYSMTADENFIVDSLPNYPHAVVLAGFSGHGFKFSSVMGEIAAQLITKGNSDYDLSAFSISRPALQPAK